MTNKEYTIDQFIKEYRETDITMVNLHLKEKYPLENGDAITFLGEPILLKYKTELDKIITTLNLTNQEFNKYQYNPKLLSYDLYGTTEFWFMILHLNQLYSTTQFSINPIKVYDTSINSLINTIINIEHPILEANLGETGY